MGDRANIIVIQDDKNFITLNGHNFGKKYVELAVKVISNKEGCFYSSSLCRILFSQMVKGSLGGHHGFSIYANEIGDNDNPVLILDAPKQKAALFYLPDTDEEDYSNWVPKIRGSIKWFSYGELIQKTGLLFEVALHFRDLDFAN